MGEQKQLARVYVRVPGKHDEYTKAGQTEYSFDRLPTVGEWIDVDSAKAALKWYRVEVVVHKLNASDGVSAHLYVVAESPPDAHGLPETIER
jgi:hypothetical protein